MSIGEVGDVGELTVSKCVVTDVVAWRVHEDEDNASNTSTLVVATGFVSSNGLLEGNCPGSVTADECASASKVQGSSLELGDEQGDGEGVDQGPACVSQVDFLLGERVLDSDHFHEITKVVAK